MPDTSLRRSRTRTLTTDGSGPLAAALRSAVATMALLALFAASLVAWNHPLGPWPALVGAAIVATLAHRFWTRWPFWMLGLVPLLGLAPWTGWIGVDEVDLLVLASACGGYLAWARLGRVTIPSRQRTHRRTLKWSLSAASLLGAYLIWTLLTAAIGVEDAGGWDFDWFQGYHEPLHAWRAAKPMIWTVLLFPWWARVARRAPERATRAWVQGMVLGLLLVCLGAVWERAAFTSLMNFSADYRTTSWFWEMHVGGAALDGTLALAFPLTVWLALRASTPRHAMRAYVLLGLASYVVLTSFSRGLYLAVLLGCAWQFWSHWRSLRTAQAQSIAPLAAAGAAPATTLAPHPAAESAPRSARGVLTVLVAVGVPAAALVFVGGGYRALAAYLVTLAALVLQRGSQTLARRTGSGVLLLMGLPFALVVTALAAALAFALPGSAYVLFAVAGVLALVAGVHSHAQRSKPMKRLQGALLGSVWSCCVGLTGVVAWYWGEADALVTAMPALFLSLPLWWYWHAEASVKATANMSWREPMAAGAALLLSAGMAAVLLGGTRVNERMKTGAEDLAGRLQHWQSSMKALDDADAWFTGLGSGRFVSRRLFMARPEDRIGDYRLTTLDGERFVRVIGGQHSMRGSALRITQRIAAPVGRVELMATVRSPQPANLLFEVCEKHLLYPGACAPSHVAAIGQSREEGSPSDDPGAWQTVRFAFDSETPLGGSWLLPRPVVFTFSVAGKGQTIDVRSLSLTGPDGRELLANGDFGADLARWFFTSDHHHMPWHLKSLPLHVLFEQGLVGLVLWSALVGRALWRVSFGAARGHPLAPAVAAGLMGFLVVGFFDSLIDAARVALLFYLCVVLALGLRVPANEDARLRRRHRRHPSGSTSATGSDDGVPARGHHPGLNQN